MKEQQVLRRRERAQRARDVERYHEEHPELVHEEIAEHFGVSRQRVQQILSAYNKRKVAVA